MSFVSIKDLSKRYGLVEAIRGISFDVEEGAAFALIGPNGAGKTSLVKSILGLVSFKGDITIGGINSRDPLARKTMAYLPEKFTFYPYYTVRAVLEFYGKMRGVSGSELKHQVQTALSKVKIEDLSERKLNTLSKGQLQRLGLGTTLVGDNKLIFLDEPFSGLDPIGIKDMKDLISEMVSGDRTVFINSHILSEIEKICTDFAIIHKGNLLELKKVSDLNGISLEDYFYEKVNQ